MIAERLSCVSVSPYRRLSQTNCSLLCGASESSQKICRFSALLVVLTTPPELPPEKSLLSPLFLISKYILTASFTCRMLLPDNVTLLKQYVPGARVTVVPPDAVSAPVDGL